MHRDASSPRHYLESVPEKQREMLEVIRAAILSFRRPEQLDGGLLRDVRAARA